MYGENDPGRRPRATVTRSRAKSSARPAGRAGKGDGPRRRSAGRLLRDRCHARGTHRHHVRGPRAPQPRAQGATRGRCRPRQSKRKGYRQVGIRVRLDKRRTVTRQAAARAAADVPPGRLTTSRRSLRSRAIPVPRRRPPLSHICRRPTRARIQRGRHLHHGHFGLDGHDEEVPGAQLLLPALPVHLDEYRNVEIVFIGHHTEANEGHRGRILPQGRIRRNVHLVGLSEGARNHRRSAIIRRLWNVYAFHCSDGDNFESDNPAALKRRQGASRHLQPVRLRRNQTARLALL